MNALVFAAAVAVSNSVAVLPPVVVEASRLGHTPDRMACPVQVLSAGDISSSGAGDIAEALARKCPQLTVFSMYGANPAGRGVAFTGYGEYGYGRTLVVMDGERLGNPDMSVPNLGRVDLGSVRSVEVLSGPQTVLHGDAASGGMINIVTDPADYEDHGHVEAGGGSWDTWRVSAGYRGGIEEDGVRYWANVGWGRSSGYRDNSGFELWNANGGVRWDAENGSGLRASAFCSLSDYDLPRGLSREQWKSDPRHSVQGDAVYPEEETDRFRQKSFGLNLVGTGVVDDENTLRLSFNASRTKTCSRMFGNGSYDDYDWVTFDYLGTMDYVWGSMMDYRLSTIRIRPEWVNTAQAAGMENELIVGAVFGYDRVDVDSDSPMYYHPDYAGAYAGHSYSEYLMDRMSMAFFGEETLHVTDWLAASAGFRYEREWSRYTAAESPRDIRDLYAYDVAMNFTPVDGMKTYVRYSTFFRNAFLDEICYRGGYAPLSTPDPETGWRADLGFEYRFAEEFLVAADCYVSDTEDEIFYNPFWLQSGYGWSKDNVNSPSPVRRTGFDASFAWERDKVAGVSLSVSGVDAEFRGGQFDGNEVPFVPSLQASADCRVWLWDDCFVSGGVRYRTAMYSISDFRNEYDRIPDFAVFRAGITFEPTFAEWARGWRLSLTCDNLFDRGYCEYVTYGTSFYPANGRSFAFTVRYEF